MSSLYVCAVMLTTDTPKEGVLGISCSIAKSDAHAAVDAIIEFAGRGRRVYDIVTLPIGPANLPDRQRPLGPQLADGERLALPEQGERR